MKDAVLLVLDQLIEHYVEDFPYDKAKMNHVRDYIEKLIIGSGCDEKLVKINTHGNELPESHGEWVDLATSEDVYMAAGSYKIIPLGVSMQLPDGYYAKVVPRSSTAKKWGIIMANSVGIIENDYCGDDDIWGFPAYAIFETHIPKGTRICQFCIVPQEQVIRFEQVKSLNNESRGGFGSTGD